MITTEKFLHLEANEIFRKRVIEISSYHYSTYTMDKELIEKLLVSVVETNTELSETIMKMEEQVRENNLLTRIMINQLKLGLAAGK